MDRSVSPQKEEQDFTQIVVYFPQSAAESRKGGLQAESPPVTPSTETHARLSKADSTVDEEDEDDWRTLRDDRGRRYQRVKVFVTASTTCSDVIDTIKLRLDIRKHVPYMLLELAYVNDHVHDRVVKPDEPVEDLWKSLMEDDEPHKLVFRRIVQPFLQRSRNRSQSNYADAGVTGVAQPLSNSRQKLYQVVGSPNYMAKEILLGLGYESAVDWWSVGCIIYELLTGSTLFDGPSPDAVFALILSTTKLEFPDSVQISDEAKSLISGFVSPAATRLGANGGLEEVRKHEWFKSVTWSELQYSEPPFLPELESALDTGYFPDASARNISRYISSSPDFSTSSHERSRLNGSMESVAEEDLWKDFDWSWFT